MQSSDATTVSRPVALITGGSKGIGLELAKQFAEYSHDLVLVARDRQDLNLAKNTLEADYSCQVICFSYDLTLEEAGEDLYQQLEARNIQIDVLVNNAGLGDYGVFSDADLDRQLQMLKINILTLTSLTRLFLPLMLKKGRGRILNVASLVAYFSGGPQWTSYVASKHYVLAFTRGLAKELANTGVSVTAVCPGATATDFVSRAGIADSRLYRWLPKTSSTWVAKAGYRATMAGRTSVVPGLLNKVFAFFGELPPRFIAQSVFSFLSKNTASRNTKPA